MDRPGHDPELCWVRTLNRLGAEMDAAVEGVHPGAWEELIGDRRRRWLSLARRGPRTPVMRDGRGPQASAAAPGRKD